MNKIEESYLSDGPAVNPYLCHYFNLPVSNRIYKQTKKKHMEKCKWCNGPLGPIDEREGKVTLLNISKFGVLVHKDKCEERYRKSYDNYLKAQEEKGKK